VKTSSAQKYVASAVLFLLLAVVLASAAPAVLASQPKTLLIPPVPSAQPPSSANPTQPGPTGNTPDSIGGSNSYLAIWNAQAGLGTALISDVTPLSPFEVVDSKQDSNHFSIQQNNGVATSLGQWYQGGGVSYWEQSDLLYFDGYVGIEIDLWKWTGTSWDQILVTGTGPNGDIEGYYCPYSDYPTYTVNSTIVFDSSANEYYIEITGSACNTNLGTITTSQASIFFSHAYFIGTYTGTYGYGGGSSATFTNTTNDPYIWSLSMSVGNSLSSDQYGSNSPTIGGGAVYILYNSYGTSIDLATGETSNLYHTSYSASGSTLTVDLTTQS